MCKRYCLTCQRCNIFSIRSLFHTLPLIITLFLITAFKTLTFKVSLSHPFCSSHVVPHTLLAHFSHFLKHCLTNTQTLKHTPNSSPKCFSNSLQFIWFEMLLTVQHLSKLRTNVHLNKFRALRFEPGTAGYDARTLPLCYAAFFFQVLFFTLVERIFREQIFRLKAENAIWKRGKKFEFLHFLKRRELDFSLIKFHN